MATRLASLPSPATLGGAGAVGAGVAFVGTTMLAWPHGVAEVPFHPALVDHAAPRVARSNASEQEIVVIAPPAPSTESASAPTPEQGMKLVAAQFFPVSAVGLLHRARYADRTDAAPFLPGPPAVPGASSRWSGSAYLFVRPGSGSALAAGGVLGGSQAGARIAYRLNAGPEVRTALAARVYAPLVSHGAEAAVGLDWHPLPSVPLRLSVERRIGLDHAGRDAWSAYVAGGFYKGLKGAFIVDGYGQTGVVGAERRDLFVDGALRGYRQIALGRAMLSAGAGLWGAAQPGVARLDAGPRMGVALPIDRRTVSLAIEGRMRVAGNAGPGSGVTLTLGTDF